MMLQTPFTMRRSSYTIDHINIYLEEELADFIVTACEPPLDGNHFHQVVSQSYRQNWDRRDIQHRVEIADLPNERQVHEVLIEKISNLAREYVCAAFVLEATECKPCKEAFNSKQRGPDYVAV